MWKKINGRLIHMTDTSRVRFKTYISRQQLAHLEDLIEGNDTHLSYLIENGLKNILQDDNFSFNKDHRLKDKIELRTTCDKDILEQGRQFAKHHKLNFTDVIQSSVEYINPAEVKRKNWRYRIE